MDNIKETVNAYIGKNPNILRMPIYRVVDYLRYRIKVNPNPKIVNPTEFTHNIYTISKSQLDFFRAAQKRMRNQAYGRWDGGSSTMPLANCFLGGKEMIVGQPTNELFDKFVPIKNLGVGCYEMPQLTQSAIAESMFELAANDCTPTVLIRVGLFSSDTLGLCAFRDAFPNLMVLSIGFGRIMLQQHNRGLCRLIVE